VLFGKTKTTVTGIVSPFYLELFDDGKLELYDSTTPTRKSIWALNVSFDKACPTLCYTSQSQLTFVPNKTFTYAKDVSRTYECKPSTPKEGSNNYTFCCSDYKLVPRFIEIGSLKIVSWDEPPTAVVISSFQIEYNERTYFYPEVTYNDPYLYYMAHHITSDCYTSVNHGAYHSGIDILIIKKDYISQEGKICYKVKKSPN